MASATINYVLFQNGPHTRRPRTGTFGFSSFSSGSLGNYPQGASFKVPGGQLPLSENVNQNNYYFAYVTVSDGTNSLTSTTFGQDTPPFTVGTGNITVFVVYVPTGLSGPGGAFGATIDAYDETARSLVDDIFVTVSPDDSNFDLTNSGNDNGFVPTTTTTEKIAASQIIKQSNATFIQWLNLLQNVPSTQSQPTFPSKGDNNLEANPGFYYLALALYQALPPKVTIPINIPKKVLFPRTIIFIYPGGERVINGAGDTPDEPPLTVYTDGPP
jgi:hypothetical protein